MKSNNQRAVIDKMAQRVRQDTNLSHTAARDMVIKHLERADNKKRG